MIENYGIRLSPLTLLRAQKVREWRNSSFVNLFMDYKEHISEQMQIDWFESVMKNGDLYFTIEHQGNAIGLIHLNKFDDDQKTAFAGIFIGEERYIGTGIAFSASLALLDFAFDNLQLDKIYAKVHNENQQAQKYNAFLGFTYDHALSEKFDQLVISKKAYLEKRGQIIAYLKL